MVIFLSFVLILLQFVDTFVDELRWEETEPAKRDKIRELKLNSEEWKHADMFLGLLAVCISPLSSFKYMKQFYQHADKAQQAFSSDQASTLHLAIPALEALHRAWFSCAEGLKYN